MGLGVTAFTYHGGLLSLSSRNQLIEEHLPIAGYITSEFLAANSGLDREEIASVAFEALVNAPSKYEAGSMSFGAFARYFIRNRVRDYLRGTDVVGRRVREQVEESKRVEHAMQVRLGRAVTISEIADAMGVKASTLQMKREMSLGDVPLPAGAEEMLADQGWSPEDAALVMERTRFISSAVAGLPEALRRVINGVFLESKSVSELAEDLGVSHAAVSARKAEALELIRQVYRSDYDQHAAVPESAKKRVSPARSERYLMAVRESLSSSPALV